MTTPMTTDNTEALMACPFCGSDAEIYHHHGTAHMDESWHIECIAASCGCGTCHHETKTEAIAAWNTRPAPADVGELGEELIHLRELMQDQIELNPSNYDHDQVCLLNTQAVEIFTVAKDLFPRILTALPAPDHGWREQIAELIAVRRDFVAKREAMNAAIPAIDATPAERALYDERYRADHEAERALFRAAQQFATWAADNVTLERPTT
jgi:hypothetical protein